MQLAFETFETLLKLAFFTQNNSLEIHLSCS